MLKLEARPFVMFVFRDSNNHTENGCCWQRQLKIVFYLVI